MSFLEPSINPSDSISPSEIQDDHDLSDDKDSSTIDSNNKKHKRERSSRACLVCRQRKVRCDAVAKHPERCSNCIQFNINECIIPMVKKRKSRKINEFLDFINNSKTEIKTEMKTDSPEIINNLNNINNINNTSNNNFPLPSFVTNDPIIEFPELSIIKLDPNKVLKPDINVSSINEYVGYSTCTPLMKQMIAQYFSERSTTLHSFSMDVNDFKLLESLGCFSLPEEKITRQYINAYFKYGYPQYPILGKNQFLKDHQDLKNPPSLLLLNSVLVAGSTLYYDPNWSTEELAKHNRTRKILYKRALALFNAKVESDMLKIIQSVMLFVTGASVGAPEQVNERSSSFLFTKVAVSMCYCIGIHRSQDNSQNLSVYEKRILKRVWWSLFVKDIYYSFSFGRPWAIDLSDSNVPMLTEIDLLESLDEKNIQNEMNDPERILEISYFIQKIKLSKILRTVLDNQISIKKYTLNDVSIMPMLDQCNKVMSQWLEGLPENLKFKILSKSTTIEKNEKDLTDENNYYAATLGIEYYSVLLVLHRNNIIRTSTVNSSANPSQKRNQIEQNIPSWSITLKASHILTILGKYLSDNNQLVRYTSFMGYSMTVACVMMIYHLYNQDQKVSKLANDDIKVCLEVLKESSKFTMVSDIAYYNMNSVYQDKSKQFTIIKGILSLANRNYTEEANNDCLNNIESKMKNDLGLIRQSELSKNIDPFNQSKIPSSISSNFLSGVNKPTLADVQVKTILYNDVHRQNSTDLIKLGVSGLQRHQNNNTGSSSINSNILPPLFSSTGTGYTQQQIYTPPLPHQSQQQEQQFQSIPTPKMTIHPPNISPNHLGSQQQSYYVPSNTPGGQNLGQLAEAAVATMPGNQLSYSLPPSSQLPQFLNGQNLSSPNTPTVSETGTNSKINNPTHFSILAHDISDTALPESIDENWMPLFDTSKITMNNLPLYDDNTGAEQFGKPYSSADSPSAHSANGNVDDIFLDLIGSTEFGYYQ